MSNQNPLHFVFLASFLFTAIVLFTLSRFLSAKLREAGYDISRLILIGLPQSDNTMSTSAPSFLDTRQSIIAQVIALLLAAASGTFIYLKFGRSVRKPALDPKEWKEFPLKEKIIVSPNTAIYRFALPHSNDILGLPIGQHISLSAEINGKEIMRSYTPTSSDDDLGHFDLLIKAISLATFLSLKSATKIRVKGPKGLFNYSPSLSREIGMIAGGTGITPMLQIIRAALKNPQDQTRLSLIYANVNYDDILLKKELDELAAKYPFRFRVHYVLNNPPPGWTGGVGFVSKEQIETHLPDSDDNIKILLCGPPPMMTAMKKHLDELNIQLPVQSASSWIRRLDG
ncbi:ferredoxin reductase-like C-terminal NADP-linked domain-containing protein [Russula earlei]|uniref:Ferredoxin reductase-like C-terminal NADP-linked domain-containing protein n=1 Tax=Russula earlei TaxID=71964 RepID=A0ACC0U0S1_9AGAM|nr:ferredoxin reductase-like C-terminal NADP-linked domain-containing protein [Russula earlei]